MDEHSKAILLAGCVQAGAASCKMGGDQTPERHAKAVAEMAGLIYRELLTTLQRGLNGSARSLECALDDAKM